MIRNRTKRANFLCNHLFRATSLRQLPGTQRTKISWFSCFLLYCTKLEKDDYIKNLHVLSCSVLLKSVLLISCVFWIFFQNAGSQLCFRFFFFFNRKKIKKKSRRMKPFLILCPCGGAKQSLLVS